ncbi:L,D-transpeptidase [Bradyrhizobium sp. HKCCYLS2033]|uniref:L,D-transpeptidase n=1 Tax=unclassified Bradyrhizobium TaxID=2631580 RepID=UPI003EBFA57F
MKGTEKRESAGSGIQRFDAKAFESKAMSRAKHFEMIAEVLEDGDHYVLNPDPCRGVRMYRIKKTEVEILSGAFPIYCDVGGERPVRRLRILSNANCFGFEHGPAALLLLPNASSEALELTTATLRADVVLGPEGPGTLTYGAKSVQCRGRKGYDYVKDITNNGVEDVDKFKRRWSDQYKVWMPWAVLIDGARGVFIHEFPLDIQSAGCIHLGTEDAQDFYNWITGKVRITISFPW